MRRYEMWSAARVDLSERLEASRAALRFERPAPPAVSKLNPFEASALIYGYGLPIDIVLDAAAKIGDNDTVACKTNTISTKRIDFAFTGSAPAPENALLGVPSAVRIEDLGEVSGHVAAASETGFQFTVDEDNRSALAERLAHAAVRRGLNSNVSLTGGERLELKNKTCEFIGPDGRPKSGRVLSLSQEDALIQAITPPKAPAIVVFRGSKQYAAEVTSSFVLGFVAKFSWRISDREFSEDIRFDLR